VLHDTPAVGSRKTASARARLHAINPLVHVETIDAELTASNALEVIGAYDVVIDGTDNFKTRYLTNDACVLLGRPNVYGSVLRFEGQASVFATPDGPCYRCLFREPPPPGLVPSCAEAGVLGVLPGLIGTIQATEAIKLIAGIGETLVGRLMLYDALAMRFRELKLRRNPDCPVCGDHPTITELIDYDLFCGIMPEPAQTDNTYEITPVEVAAWLKRDDAPFLLDVREPNEWDIGHLPDATRISVNELQGRMNELDTAREMVVYCRSGARSGRAVDMLRAAGFRKVKNMTGGILRWSDEVDSSIPKY
jgi:adenylyltransferase/sulfurtransferase